MHATEFDDQFFEGLFDQNPAIKLLIDPADGHIVSANSAACHFYGYSRDEFRTLCITDIDQSPPDEVRERLREACDGRCGVFVFPHRLKSGQLRQVAEHSCRIRSQDRTLLYLVLHDLTEQLRLERRLELAMKVAELGTWDWSVGAPSITWSRSLFEMFGFRPPVHEGEVAFGEFTAHVHPDDRQLVDKAIRQAADRDAALDIEFRIVRDDGDERVLHARGDLLHVNDPEPPHMIGVAFDITREREYEHALRTSERRFRAIADYTYDFEAWLDNDGHVLWVNPTATRMTGYRVDECIDLPDFPLPLVCPEDRPLVCELLTRMRHGSSGNDMEFRLQHRDGSIFWCAMSWQPICDDQGHPLGFRTSIRDISRRKTTENQLRATVRKLEDTLSKVHSLRGMLPICAGCKRIRTDAGYWEQIEVYVREHSDAEFSHGLCPDCAHRLYPDVDFTDLQE